LVEHSDTGAWHVAATPDVGKGSNGLNAVSCAGTGPDCLAVGVVSSRRTAGVPLAELWDGNRWSIMSVPSPAVGDGTLQAVSCVPGGGCTAVGEATDSRGVEHTLVEASDGSIWSVQTSPDASAAGNVLRGVACPTPAWCVAVGDAFSAGVERTLAEIWDGSAWSVVPTPDAGTGADVLAAASCVASTDCVAAGFAIGPAGARQTLIEAWDGAAWSIVASPNVGTAGSQLTGVSCSAANACAAVGSSVGSDTYNIPLVETWDGTAWTVSASSAPSRNDSLTAVSCPPGAGCTAVGSQNQQQTLVEVSG
jgi:hypothetical protein